MVKPWHVLLLGGGAVAVILIGIWWRQRQAKKAGSATETAASRASQAVTEPQGIDATTETVYDLTDDDIPNITKRNGIIVLMVYHPGCGWCKKMMPEFYKAAAASAEGDITWARLDSEACPQAASALGIRSFPTTLIFRDGSLLHTVPGATDAETLINQVVK